MYDQQSCFSQDVRLLCLGGGYIEQGEMIGVGETELR
jgi:hypothetical protein